MKQLCADSPNPDLWFPPAGGMGTLIGKQAKAICAQCPVEEPCLEYALADWTLLGIWGGTTPKEREKIRRARAAPPATDRKGA